MVGLTCQHDGYQTLKNYRYAKSYSTKNYSIYNHSIRKQFMQLYIDEPGWKFSWHIILSQQLCTQFIFNITKTVLLYYTWRKSNAFGQSHHNARNWSHQVEVDELLGEGCWKCDQWRVYTAVYFLWYWNIALTNESGRRIKAVWNVFPTYFFYLFEVTVIS